MPLWLIYHPPSTFTSPTEKSALANKVTEIYKLAPIPAFYVNVLFVPVQPDSYYIGGVARPSKHDPSNGKGPNSEKPFIRITIQNIARKISDAASRDRFLGRVDEALKPFIEDKGYDWEYSVDETSRDLWKIQGMVPPMPQTPAESLWIEENQAVPY